uniref:Protein phosphatase n=1 Tax=Solanum lycopersicum TaxID=4081 RepID=A0A3Q7GMH3_SOLLC
MAISILRPSISLPQHFLNSMNPQKFSSISVIRKKQSFLHCVASDSAPSPARQEMSLSVGMYLIPHPNKASSKIILRRSIFTCSVEKGGEDAFFVSSDNGGVIVVADGVSGWAEKNVDPALFSRELVANVSSLVGNVEVNDDPRILIKGAHAATSSIGSATVIVSVFENGILKIASVGDCGLRVIRKGQMIFSTFPLEHYFDCPYQLSSEAVSQTYLDAIVSTVNLQVGDTIIMGSDGLFDNIFDQEIVSVVTTNDDVSNAAKALADLARNHSVDTKFDSPFSLEARARGFDVPWWKKVFGMKLTGMTSKNAFCFFFYYFLDDMPDKVSFPCNLEQEENSMILQSLLEK